MSYQEDLEYRIKELGWVIDKKNSTIEKLQNDLIKSDDKLNSAEFRIHNELEPRIESEKRSYDNWVISPEAHMSEDDATCLHYYEIDECGSGCPIFGNIQECTENLSDKELLKEYIENDAIESVLFDRGLWFRKLKIDWEMDTHALKNSKDRIKVEKQRRFDKLIYNVKNKRG